MTAYVVISFLSLSQKIYYDSVCVCVREIDRKQYVTIYKPIEFTPRGEMMPYRFIEGERNSECVRERERE